MVPGELEPIPQSQTPPSDKLLLLEILETSNWDSESASSNRQFQSFCGNGAGQDAILREPETLLLELGAGFSFVARQKRIQLDIPMVIGYGQSCSIVGTPMKVPRFFGREAPLGTSAIPIVPPMKTFPLSVSPVAWQLRSMPETEDKN